jgi:hypothetical protein
MSAIMELGVWHHANQKNITAQMKKITTHYVACSIACLGKWLDTIETSKNKKLYMV